MNKVLITGATGFVGNRVVHFLVEKGIDVVASSKNIDKAKDFSWFTKVNYVPYTIGDIFPKSLMGYFETPDLLIHLAWDGLSDFRNEAHESTFFQNHWDFLQQFVKEGLKKIVVSGTCLEYGMQEGELAEEMEVFPQLSYPKGKNKLRQSLVDLQKKCAFQLDWVRLFYMHGQGQHPKSIFPQLQRHIDEKQPVFNMSKGEQLRDYLPVEKVAEVIVNLALTKSENGIVNCCSGNPVSIQSLVEEYLEQAGVEMTLNLGHYPYPDYEPFAFWGSTKKMNEILRNGNNLR